MKVIYVDSENQSVGNKPTVFLAGPTPRSNDVKSWRPDFLDELNRLKFNGTVFVPENADGIYKNYYLDQVEWELSHIETADLVVFWVPRDLDTLPGFTTNVEFGYCMGRDPISVLYGRPNGAPKTKYLDHLFLRLKYKPFDSIQEMAEEILKLTEWKY